MASSSSRSRGYNDGGFRLSGRDMLPYGFKNGEPWAEDRRALERAFREIDLQSAWSPQSSHVDAGSTLSTLNSGGSATTGKYSRYSRNYGSGDRRGYDSWQSQALSRSGSRHGTRGGSGGHGMEVMRLGEGDRAQYSGPSSGRTIATMTYAGRHYPRTTLSESSESGLSRGDGYTIGPLQDGSGGHLMQHRHAPGSPHWDTGSQSRYDLGWNRAYSQEYGRGYGSEDAPYHGSDGHGGPYYSGTTSTVSSGWDDEYHDEDEDDDSELGWASSDSDGDSQAVSGYLESESHFDGESQYTSGEEGYSTGDDGDSDWDEYDYEYSD